MIAWALFSVLLAPGVRDVAAACRASGRSTAARGAIFCARPMLAVVRRAGGGDRLRRLHRAISASVCANRRSQFPASHPDLDGLRLVQLTDIHLSPFLSERELDRAVAMANETRAHMALVTGDLITIAARSAGSVPEPPGAACAPTRASSAAWEIMRFMPKSKTTSTEQGARLGIRFLRKAAAPLQFGERDAESGRRGLSALAQAVSGGRGEAGRSRALQCAAVA